MAGLHICVQPTRSAALRERLVEARILLARARPVEAGAALAERGRAVAAIGHSG